MSSSPANAWQPSKLWNGYPSMSYLYIVFLLFAVLLIVLMFLARLDKKRLLGASEAILRQVYAPLHRCRASPFRTCTGIRHSL